MGKPEEPCPIPLSPPTACVTVTADRGSPAVALGRLSLTGMRRGLGEAPSLGCHRRGPLPALSRVLLWFLSPPPLGSPPRPQGSTGPKPTSKREKVLGNAHGFSLSKVCPTSTHLLVLTYPVGWQNKGLCPICRQRNAQQADEALDGKTWNLSPSLWD